MRCLNLPIMEELKTSNNIMFVGLGGGFDVYAALPIAYCLASLNDKYRNFVLVNSSGSKDFTARESTLDDYPEGCLSKHDLTVYSVGRHGVQAVRSVYQQIAGHHEIDTLIAVDGGVDSLMHGDEKNSGTVLEDFIALSALKGLQINQRFMACLGFGSETEEELNHYRALENIAQLAKSGDFLGSCSLTSEMLEFKMYQRRCEEAWDQGRKSHIQSKVISSVQGDFGDCRLADIDARLHGEINEKNFISPLTSIYWFFDLAGVIRNNQIVEKLEPSRSFTDAMMLYRQHATAVRDRQALPL